MAKRKKDKRTNNDAHVQNTTQTTKDWETRTPFKSGKYTQVLRKGRQFLLHYWHDI
jgi:hypothetical protein